jgi:hypothetical protein
MLLLLVYDIVKWRSIGYHLRVSKLFSFMNTYGLKALKKNGDPENDNGETGP